MCFAWRSKAHTGSIRCHITRHNGTTELPSIPHVHDIQYAKGYKDCSPCLQSHTAHFSIGIIYKCTLHHCCMTHSFSCMLSAMREDAPCMALVSASKSSPAPALLVCTFAPVRCMSVSALCNALSVASAGRSELSSLSPGTFAQSVLQSQLTRHDPLVEKRRGRHWGGRKGKGKEGVTNCMTF